MVNQAHSFSALPCPRPSLGSRLIAGLRAWRLRREHRQAMAQLLTAEPRLLKDIGLDRATVIGQYDNPRLGLRDADRA
jgi:uncharacterized protein YjiS (DUF1127 family)